MHSIYNIFYMPSIPHSQFRKIAFCLTSPLRVLALLHSFAHAIVDVFLCRVVVFSFFQVYNTKTNVFMLGWHFLVFLLAPLHLMNSRAGASTTPASSHEFHKFQVRNKCLTVGETSNHRHHTRSNFVPKWENSNKHDSFIQYNYRTVSTEDRHTQIHTHTNARGKQPSQKQKHIIETNIAHSKASLHTDTHTHS